MPMTSQEKREYFKKLLEEIPEVKKAYFQPPESVKLVYPCIIYRWDGERELHADDIPYHCRKMWVVTVIDFNPDSRIPDILHKNFPMSSFERMYASDNLNHWVYKVYF